MSFLTKLIRTRSITLQRTLITTPKYMSECRTFSTTPKFMSKCQDDKDEPTCQLEEERCRLCPQELCCEDTPQEGEGHNNSRIYQVLTLFICIPAIIINTVLQYKSAAARKAECEERPEFVPYDHMRIRSKKFPWGDGNHSLFHNPHVNALPSGYEEKHDDEEDD